MECLESGRGFFCYLVGHDVDEAVWDDDDLADRAVADEGLYVFICHSDGFDFFFGGVFADHYLRADFTVHLNYELDFGFDEVFLNELWPWLLGEELVVPELLIDFFGDVWSKWVEHLEEVYEEAHWEFLSVGEGVGADHHL